MNDMLSALKEGGIPFSESVSLKDYTTFKTGGICRLMISPTTVEQAISAVKILKDSDIVYHVLGNGSNVLAPDDPGDDVYLSTCGLSAINISVSGNEGTVIAESGAILAKVAYGAYKNSLTGMEFAHGIPGSVGGACVMNAGAYGGEMSQIVASTTYIDKNGRISKVSGDEHLFGYRKSVFTPDDIIISTEIRLSVGDPYEIKAKMDELAAKRRASQPLEYPSAGSTFKRPEGHFAGRLIEDAGLKGYTIGGAQVSVKHAGFLINIGGATTQNVLDLISYVQKTVYEKSGVCLEPEVKIIKRSDIE